MNDFGEKNKKGEIFPLPPMEGNLYPETSQSRDQIMGQVAVEMLNRNVSLGVIGPTMEIKGVKITSSEMG